MIKSALKRVTVVLPPLNEKGLEFYESKDDDDLQQIQAMIGQEREVCMITLDDENNVSHFSIRTEESVVTIFDDRFDGEVELVWSF